MLELRGGNEIGNMICAFTGYHYSGESKWPHRTYLLGRNHAKLCNILTSGYDKSGAITPSFSWGNKVED